MWLCEEHAGCAKCGATFEHNSEIVSPGDPKVDREFMHATPECARGCVQCNRYLSITDEVAERVGEKLKWGGTTFTVKPVICSDDDCTTKCPECGQHFVSFEETWLIEKMGGCRVCYNKMSARRAKKRVLNDLYDVIEGADEYFSSGGERPRWAEKLREMKSTLRSMEAHERESASALRK